MSKKTTWGEDEDEGEYETKVDERGQKMRVRIKMNNKGQKVKVITTIQVRENKLKVPKRVLERRNLPRFGEAVEGEVNVTLQSRDYIAMEHPDDQLVEDAEDQLSSLQSFIQKQQERQLERETDMEAFDLELESQAAAAAGTDAAGAAPSSSSGKYQPPGARGSTTGKAGGLESAFGKFSGDRETENTIRVSNLTKAVTEDDLRELFGRFGRISRVFLPKAERKDDRGNIIKEPKGYAYIAFALRADAEAAMNRLQGHGYDHLILKLEWAKAPDPSSSRVGLAGGFVSGYGEKLAQETKEKVVFASNLTENR